MNETIIIQICAVSLPAILFGWMIAITYRIKRMDKQLQEIRKR